MSFPDAAFVTFCTALSEVEISNLHLMSEINKLNELVLCERNLGRP